jgi:hypothetical protein
MFAVGPMRNYVPADYNLYNLETNRNFKKRYFLPNVTKIPTITHWCSSKKMFFRSPKFDEEQWASTSGIPDKAWHWVLSAGRIDPSDSGAMLCTLSITIDYYVHLFQARVEDGYTLPGPFGSAPTVDGPPNHAAEINDV